MFTRRFPSHENLGTCGVGGAGVGGGKDKKGHVGWRQPRATLFLRRVSKESRVSGHLEIESQGNSGGADVVGSGRGYDRDPPPSHHAGQHMSHAGHSFHLFDDGVAYNHHHLQLYVTRVPAGAVGVRRERQRDSTGYGMTLCWS